MASRAEMRRAGRRVRAAFDNYLEELVAANTAGIQVTAQRVIPTIDGDDVVNDPLDPMISAEPTLRHIRFSFAFTERLEQSELDDPGTA